MNTRMAHSVSIQPVRMAALLMAAAMLMSACAGSATPSGSAAANCDKGVLALKTKGTLTLSTDNPAYSPWFAGGNDGATVFNGEYGNDPNNGQGFEGALAYAIATKLGFAKSEVTWIVTTFDQSFAPGPKAFDLFLNQVSIKADRAQAVDFSDGYYDVAQGVVTVEGSKIAGATSIADLKGAKLGAQIGTTSYQAILDTIKPTTEPAVFNTNDDAVAALNAGTIDGIVVDVPTAFYMRDAQLTGGMIVGQLPQSGATPEQFGVVLEKGSTLTSCVDAAIKSLKEDGTIAALEQTWLAEKASAPILK